jgi:hypothetical protein
MVHMMSKSWLLMFIGAAALGTVAYGYSANAAIPNRCEALPNPQSRAECACEWALEQNTVVAIEEFMAMHGSENTACNAMALVPQNRPDNDREITPPSGSPG